MKISVPYDALLSLRPNCRTLSVSILFGVSVLKQSIYSDWVNFCCKWRRISVEMKEETLVKVASGEIR